MTLRRLVVVVPWILALTACGGGGGGGGAAPAAGGGGSAGSSVAFTGFSFLLGSGVETSVPPLESPQSIPPTVGAGLNTVVRFHFDGVPSGPLNPTTLPVFTTPAEVTPAAGAPGTQSTIPAKGSYVLVVDKPSDLYLVEFRPSLPVGTLNVKLSSAPETVPGLLPGSVYTAMVSTTPGASITNLQGAGGVVKFGTTSNPAAYFPSDPNDDDAPAVVYVDDTGALLTQPADGSTDFYPGTWSTHSLSSSVPTFPAGPSDFLLAYDRAVIPTSANVIGGDLDGDDRFDPTFFLRARATELLVSQSVPAGGVAGGGAHAAFEAISGYEPGQSGDVTGGEVIVHASTDGALPSPSPGLSGVVKAMASGPDPGLLFLVLDVPGGDDLITVGDAFLGDPSVASLATDMLGGVETTLPSGLDDLVGLASLQDGRLVGFERTSRTLVELSVGLTRQRPRPDKPTADPPVLEAVSTGADGGSGLFQSAAWPSGLTVHDIAQAPSGLLFALGTLAGASFPSLVSIGAIDPDLDSEFTPADGVWSGSTADVVFAFGSAVESLEFVGETRVMALDRSADAIVEIDLTTGMTATVVSDVGSFGQPLPGGLSPAHVLALGWMDLDVEATLEVNDPGGSVVRLAPRGVLPVGAELSVMQRHVFTSLSGVNALNATNGELLSPLGATAVLRVSTATPLAGAATAVSDVFREDFVDKLFENPLPISTNPKAEWADSIPGAGSSGGLRASVGASESAQLGDFLPITDPGWNVNLAYVRSQANTGDPSLDLTKTDFTIVLLDTDAQAFPLSDGSTPGVTIPRTVFGGHFVFHDFIIPEGVHVVAQGSNPLRITATGSVRIDGVLDVRGTNGLSDDTFDSGFLPVPGGSGGPGGGRGGDGHPTLFDPKGPGTINQYVTPETGERGWGPVVDAAGSVLFKQVGGFGGLCALGYDPSASGIPKLDQYQNTEHHRPPGGGGGSFYTVGEQAHVGTGSYVVQSSSTWFPFSKCVGNEDSIQFALIGNEENFWQGLQPNTPLQCVYMLGTPAAPQRFLPGGLPGDPVFVDGTLENDFIGSGGELGVVIGGQGGGGGGSRIDCMRQRIWAGTATGGPVQVPPLAPPYYPTLFFGLYFSPTLYDAKGGAGGGGGGSVQIRAYGDIIVGRLGHIDARGGHGGGGEVVQNACFSAGGGGGSGGAILLQAAGRVVLEADAGHRSASYKDGDGDMGASLEVSGGFGRDARSDPRNKIDFISMTYDSTRSDGGQGGMGLIQLQSGGVTGLPEIQEGAFAFAKKRATLKLGKWTGNADNLDQEWHPTWAAPIGELPPDELRYIDMLHYRYFAFDGATNDRYYVLTGAYPPLTPILSGDNGSGLAHEYPEGSGQLWFDTKMIETDLAGGRTVVQEPQPNKVMKSYLGWDPVTFTEPFWQQGPPPGELYAVTDVIPFSVHLNEPDGTPKMVVENGETIFDPAELIDRLPVVHPSLTPPPIGSVSHGTSAWIDFNGVALRTRDITGRAPPFFEGIHGTFNAGAGVLVPAGAEGRVRTAAIVPVGNIPAHYVVDAGISDPGLFPGSGVGEGLPPNPPFNDIKVDALDPGIGLEDVVTDNATVSLLFQGAYPVRAGSTAPDLATLTDWVGDLSTLDGYPLVRFRVAFDLGANAGSYPFGVDSLRPSVDYIRLRATY